MLVWGNNTSTTNTQDYRKTFKSRKWRVARPDTLKSREWLRPHRDRARDADFSGCGPPLIGWQEIHLMKLQNNVTTLIGPLMAPDKKWSNIREGYWNFQKVFKTFWTKENSSHFFAPFLGSGSKKRNKNKPSRMFDDDDVMNTKTMTSLKSAGALMPKEGAQNCVLSSIIFHLDHHLITSCNDRCRTGCTDAKGGSAQLCIASRIFHLDHYLITSATIDVAPKSNIGWNSGGF